MVVTGTYSFPLSTLVVRSPMSSTAEVKARADPAEIADGMLLPRVG